MAFSRLHPPAPETANHHGADVALAELLGHESGNGFAAASLTSARTTAPGLISPTRLIVWNAGISASRLCSSSFGFSQSNPRLRARPSCVRAQAIIRLVRPGVGPIEIDGQELANRRAVILAAGERIRATQHQQPAAALADEIPYESQLVRREKSGFEIVKHDRVITVQFVGRLGKTIPQLNTVEFIPEPDQDRLVGPLGRFGVGMIKPIEQRAGRLGARSCESRTWAGDWRYAPGRQARSDRLLRARGGGT